MKRPELPTTPCVYCLGRGANPSPQAGEMLRREREERHVSRISKGDPPIGLAHHIGLSESYLLDLERGVRPLTWEMVDRYRAAIEAAVAVRLERETEVPV